MKKDEIDTQKARSWKSNLHFRFDNTAMPRIVPYLGVTKNEIATKVMHSRNAERAIKVMDGASTDMKDMLTLCARYDIDLAQLLLLPNGKHPVILTEEEYYRLCKATDVEDPVECREDTDNETQDDEREPEQKEITMPETRIDNDNAASLIGIIKENGQKITSLYERIVELTVDNANLKAAIGKYDYNIQTGLRMVCDGTEKE